MQTLQSMPRRQFSKKWLIIAILSVVIISSLGVVAYYLFNPVDGDESTTSPDIKYTKVNYDAPSDDQKAAGDQQKNNTINSDADPNTPSNSIDVTFSAVNQNGGTVQVRAITPRILQGSCVLVISRGSVTKTYTAEIQSLSSTSTCAGFDIPVADIQSGEWSIKLTITSTDSKKGDVSTTLTVK